ncbi:hypothetical protein [Thioalkalivibrio sp. ALJ7]|uniref:hypothetical protein n=1 Tax=Thioalkalivibrio sp. ALJ7 TaxID=1158756 RepID=UPI00038210CB|nr:hypothetical protein [Thioalkalivibrio sp. ALJ7]
MAWLIPYVIVFLMAVGILSERRRASFRTRVTYAVAVLAAPPALIGVGMTANGLDGTNLSSPVLMLLVYVIVPLVVVWNFVYWHPHTPTGKREMKSFRVSVGRPPKVARDESNCGKNFESTVVLGGYFGLVIGASYFLPQDILSSLAPLREFVGFMELHFSGVQRFGLWSEFSEVAQLVYSVQLLLVPALVLWTVVSLRAHLRKGPGVVWIGLAIIPVFGSAAFLLLSGVYPSGPELSGLFGRLSKLSYTSEFWFSVWSVVITYASAVFISLVYVAFRDLLLFWGVYRSSKSP